MMTLDPETLRRTPQLASLDLLVQVSETTVIALCAAHPNLEDELPGHPLPIDRLADHVVRAAMTSIEAIERYRLLLHDLQLLRRGTLLDHDDDLF